MKETARSEAKTPIVAEAPFTPRMQTFGTPRWLRGLGLSAWLTIGISVVVVLVVAVGAALATVTIPLLLAALLGATLAPLVTRLTKWGLPRWLASLAVTLLVVLAGIGLALLLVYSVMGQSPSISANLNEGVASLKEWVAGLGLDSSSIDEVEQAVKSGLGELVHGVVPALASGVSSVASIIFGIFILLNMLFFILKDGRVFVDWVSGHMGLPQPIARPIITDSVVFLRKYFVGTTLVGLFNAVVMTLGALLLGVPMALTIGIVGWATNYIPYFGAIIGGAFAVLIAFSSGGATTALLMLVFVFLANGILQTLVQQFVLAGTLKLHPLVILVVTTVGSIVGGAIGGVFSAPLFKLIVTAMGRLRAAGAFGGASSNDQEPAPVAVPDTP